MKTKKQRERIIENIFDIICNTQFKEQAEKEMIKDLGDKNISFNKANGTIDIETHNATRIQYTISIK